MVLSHAEMLEKMRGYIGGDVEMFEVLGHTYRCGDRNPPDATIAEFQPGKAVQLPSKLRRGPLKDVRLADGELFFELEWCAELMIKDGKPVRWVRASQTLYSVTLSLFRIESRENDDRGLLALYSSVLHEWLQFYPIGETHLRLDLISES